MSLADKTLQCRECGNEFVWSAGEQAFYAEKGLQNQPSRCPDCRAKRRASGGASGGAYSGGGSSFSGSRERSSDRGERVQHPVTCASCGAETTVPFVPKYDRPVYCSDCFERERGNAQAGARR